MSRNLPFQAAGLVACIAVFFTHLQEGASAVPDATQLTMSHQALVARLLGWLVPDPAIFASLPFTVLMFSGFAGAMLAATWRRQGSDLARAVLVSCQLLIGVLFSNDLLLILAAQLPVVYRTPVALRWLILQTVGMVLAWGFVALTADVSGLAAAQRDPAAALDDARRALGASIAVSLLIFTAWQLFAFGLGYIATSERRSRERLAAANAQLLATQQLLAESARSSERLRIARELHDGMGHHLTALKLHLELADRQAPAGGSAAIRTARGIARDLLQEVRNAVGRERSEAPVDLARSLRTLCNGIPVLRVELDIGPGCSPCDSARAHAIFRGVQEALSNVMHHAEAGQVRVRLQHTGRGIEVEVRDDGRGAPGFAAGNGLRGMQERIAACGGSMEAGAPAGGGFAVKFWLPDTGSTP